MHCENPLRACRDALVEALDEAEEELAELGENVDADEFDAELLRRRARAVAGGGGTDDSGEEDDDDDGDDGLWGMYDQANWQPGVWSAARLPKTP